MITNPTRKKIGIKVLALSRRNWEQQHNSEEIEEEKRTTQIKLRRESATKLVKFRTWRRTQEENPHPKSNQCQ